VDVLSSLLGWFVENEAALSGVAAAVVIIGFIASPLGAGLRSLARRKSVASSVGLETADAPRSSAEIPALQSIEVDRPSIAVLPFVSTAEDKESELFADGMTDDIITALGQVPGFFVTSSNSTFGYKGHSTDTREIGRELGVRYVVEGRIQRAGNDVRINVKLVEAHTGEQIWSDRLSGDLSDIFALQDDIGRSIVTQLQPELMQAEWRRGSRTPTEDLDAWTLLHSARIRFQVGFSREALEEAERVTKVAVERDPAYAEAHGLLTELIMDQIAVRWSDDPAKDFERAASHCRKALELDPENPIVLFSATVLYMFSGHPEIALEKIERCCAINPNDAFAQGIRGFVLGLNGRGEEGLDAADLAVRLSPRDPRAFWLLLWEAYVYAALERYEEAEQVARRSYRQNENFFWSSTILAIALAMQGKKEDAGKALAELKRVSPDFELQDLEANFKNLNGNPTDERATLIDQWISSLHDIWPS